MKAEVPEKLSLGLVQTSETHQDGYCTVRGEWKKGVDEMQLGISLQGPLKNTRINHIFWLVWDSVCTGDTYCNLYKKEQESICVSEKELYKTKIQVGEPFGWTAIIVMGREEEDLGGRKLLDFIYFSNVLLWKFWTCRKIERLIIHVPPWISFSVYVSVCLSIFSSFSCFS